jgi:hypothetical protein
MKIRYESLLVVAAALLLLLAAAAAATGSSDGQPEAAAAAGAASVLAYSASDGCAILGSGCVECQVLRIIREDHNPSFPTAEAQVAAADAPGTQAATTATEGEAARTQSMLPSAQTPDPSNAMTASAAGTVVKAPVLQSINPDAADAAASDDRALQQGYIPGPYDYAGQQQYQPNPYSYPGQQQQYQPDPYSYAGQQQYQPGPRMYYGPHGFHSRVSGVTDIWSCMVCDEAGHYVVKKMPDGSSRCGKGV